MSLTVQRADARYLTTGDGWVGRYCFSFGEHYEPSNVSFGPLVACNEFDVEPFKGFPEHHHGGIEVVSWVLEGRLLHDEDEHVERGGLQVLSTGTGIDHSETNPGLERLRLLQMWLVPEDLGGAPAHHLVAAPGGFGPVALPLRQPGAALHAGSLRSGETARLPDEPFVFVFVADGEVALCTEDTDAQLGPGDSARLTAPGEVTAATGARLLAWAMRAG